MEWTDTALVIGVRRHGETSVILEAMTRDHGRHLGLVRGGRSRSMQPVLQSGNSVDIVWRARLDEHLGMFAVEPVKARAGRLMATASALHGLNHLCGLLHLLAERDPHLNLYDMALAIADHLDEPRLAPDLLVRFELAMLAALGVGLDLERCALSGATSDLTFVSPKSGRAVARTEAAPWQDRLLPLPAFLAASPGVDHPAVADIIAAFRLTGHFLEREIFEPRGTPLPAARERFLAEVVRLADEMP